jgi:methylated-DNA-[protein]-cysteine S-methyltransferase
LPGFYYQTQIGKIGIAQEGGFITRLAFEGESLGDIEIKETPLIKEAARQLESYLKGELREFDLPLAPKGTPFYREVWDQLLKIPYGKTDTYKGVAEKVGRPKALRAVGMANNRNPIPVIIPCHRVIGSDGGLTGYGGGLDLKKRLLELERSGH